MAGGGSSWKPRRLNCRQNIAELLVYVDDHAAHLANCASANDDSTLMSAELIPRLEGGIRAVLDEAASL